MLQHEIVFGQQVRELHRLYWTQRNLMNELRQRTIANSRQVGSEIGLSFEDAPRPFNLDLPVPAGEAAGLDEKKVSRDSTLGIGCGLFCGRLCNSGRSVAMDKSNCEGWRQEKPTHPHAELLGSDGAFSIDDSTLKEQSIPLMPILIDLNETVDDEYSDAWHDPLSTIPSSSISSSVVQCGASSSSHAKIQQFTSFQSESSNQCPQGTPVGDQSKASHLASKYTSENNAINSFHGSPDSFFSSAQASTHNVETTVDFTQHKQQGVANLARNSSFHTLTDLQRTTIAESSSEIVDRVRVDINGKVPSAFGSFVIDCKDAEQPLGELSCDVHNNSDSSRQAFPLIPFANTEGANLHASVGSTNLPPTLRRDSEDKKCNHEESEEDTLSSHTIARGEHQETCAKDVPFVRNHELVVSLNDESGSGDQCKEKHAVSSITEESRMIQTESLVSLVSDRNKQVLVAEAFSHSSVQIGSCNVGKPKCQDYCEKDSFIFTAAEVLVFISSGKPECPGDRLSGFEQIELEADECEKPQCSCDSFESLTLMLPESKIDEYPVPVIPTEIVTENNVCDVKLRRGRGLGDFQDILPGLVSLSRHEICEDLHTIKYALRNCKTKTRVNWLAPVRNLRSRRCRTNTRS
ncbi:hypothetical protein J5N97_001941 [Dioscorea zingiberensis]|uniref:Uncharacterized protein n=1 Tax=Dioscorea zingiberensis TaxID=325984 RepID=A0A9D5H210_9LILI|nr:hypothetical protein J5N97_001941 [Dioscorea zingiberensis]